MLSDINVYKDGDYLFFNSIGLSSKIEDCLLNTNYEVAPYIVFVKKDDMWSAFELDTKQKFLDYCAMSEFDNSIRIVFEKFDYGDLESLAIEMPIEINCYKYAGDFEGEIKAIDKYLEKNAEKDNLPEGLIARLKIEKIIASELIILQKHSTDKNKNKSCKKK